MSGVAGALARKSRGSLDDDDEQPLRATFGQDNDGDANVDEKLDAKPETRRQSAGRIRDRSTTKSAMRRNRSGQMPPVEMPPHGLTSQQRKEVERAFRTFDTDGSGSIDAFELKLAMRALGLKMGEEEIELIMEEVDVDKSGEIDIDEFMEVVRPGIGGKDTMYDVKKCFYEYFDVSGDGKMSVEEFEQALPIFGEALSAREMKTAFDLADKGSKGYIDEIDWIDLCSDLNLGPAYSEHELAEVMMIRDNLEKYRAEQKEERWKRINMRGGVEYNFVETVPVRVGTCDVHDLADLHTDPETWVPPPLPPAVERRPK